MHAVNASQRGTGYLSARTRAAVASDCWTRFGRPVRWVDDLGDVAEPLAPDQPLTLRPLQQTVRDALREAHRWGEPCTFFLCPGVLAWIVPLCDSDQRYGGILSGEVVLDEADRAEAAHHLQEFGLPAHTAQEWAAALPVWPEGRAEEASARLYDDFYRRSGWVPAALTRRRQDAAQQRQIAEAIHSRKRAARAGYPVDDERRLLALIRVGDSRGARAAMNELLGGLFVHSPALPVLRARAIELLGYLVRAAVEDNPMLEPLIEWNQTWIERLVSEPDFDAICSALRDALDDFIATVAAQGFNLTNTAVQKALDHVAAHYADGVTLEDVAAAAGLSTYRIAHLVKEATGRSVMGHVRTLRVTRARELLEGSTLKGSEIAAQLGYHDQSHLIREFRAVIGIPPEKYRRSIRQAAR